MNSIVKINAINQKELENNVSDSASWHSDYRDTPYIYIGFIPQELAEPDIIAIFSQYGVPTHINLIKDKETGRSRGFCYLKYEDHRSCILAIDNFNGITVFDKKLKVDHVYYQLKDGQNEDDFKIDYSEAIKDIANAPRIGDEKNDGEGRLRIKSRGEERGTERDANDDDFRDPMEDFKDPMEDFLREKSPTRHSKSSSRRERDRSDGSREKSHRSRDSSDRSHRSHHSSHRSDSHRSSSHRSDSHRSSSHRSSSHRSGTSGSSTSHRSHSSRPHKPTDENDP